MGLFDRFRRNKKQDSVTPTDTLDTQNNIPNSGTPTSTYVQDDILKKAKESQEQFDNFLNYMDSVDEQVTDLLTPSPLQQAIFKKGANDLLARAARQQYQEHYDDYVKNNDYANTFNQLLKHLFHQQLNDNLGLHVRAPYSGTTKEGVLAQYNYDKLLKKCSPEKVPYMFIPYMQEVEERCGTIQYSSEHLPQSIIDMYTKYKTDTSEANKQEQLESGLLMIKISGIADLEDPKVFPNIPTNTRQSILRIESSKVDSLRQTIGIVDQLPPEYQKCIKSDTKSEEKAEPTQEKQQKTPQPSRRSYLDSRPPDLR